MLPESSDPNPAQAARFEQTRWSIVVTAADGDSTKARKALTHLCETYWYPLYAFVRREGHSAHDAQDLTQEFFARLIEKRKLAGLVREKGKFRSFLLTAMNNFLTDEWKRAEAQKRGAHQIISLDAAQAETRYRLEPADTLTPEKIFAKNWALTLLKVVYERLQKEFSDDGKAAQFEALSFALTGDKSAVPYAELSAKLSMSESAVKVAVHRLRQRYREVLRDEVGQTVDSPEEIEAELRDLMRALAG